MDFVCVVCVLGIRLSFCIYANEVISICNHITNKPELSDNYERARNCCCGFGFVNKIEFEYLFIYYLVRIDRFYYIIK